MTESRTRKVAAFDFDGTVSRKDTVIPFVNELAGYPRTAAAVVAAGAAALTRRISPTDRDQVKEFMVDRLLKGRSVRELERLGGVYAANVIDTGLNPAVVEELRRHVAAGHETVFVSASLVYYLRPIARYFNMDHTIAVEPEVVDGVLTGRMPPNVRAAEKRRLIEEWLSTTGGAQDVELWAYGNSSGDHELLAMADHAFWLGKESKRPAGCKQGVSAF
jgi:phosphatidylglycerophosphatase C